MVLVDYVEALDSLQVVPLWINGAAHPIDSPSSLFPITSSVKDTPIHHAVSCTPNSATAAIDAAAAAFVSWRRTAPSFRRSLLLKAADVLERRGQEIMSAQIAETSCPPQFAGFNIKAGVEYVREIAAATSELRGTVPQRLAEPGGNETGGLTVVIREPVGVVLIIPP
jgi:acyl-CoA reductase-like NAD-dependent aldehyde dehydrogenase